MKAGGSKIRLVVGISDFRIGGAQKVVSDMLWYLNSNEFEIHLVTLFQNESEDTFYSSVPEYVTVHKFNFKGFTDYRSWRQLFKFMKCLKPEVVWTHLYFSNTLFRVLRLVFNYKVISVEHNTYVNRTFAQRLVNTFLALFTYKIVAVSQFVADHTAKYEHISTRKFVVIHNGVKVDTLKTGALNTDKERTLASLGLKPEHKLIINVGQLIYQKNQELLIESFAHLVKNQPSCRLLILGEGSQRIQLEALVDRLGLSETVFLPGIKRNVAEYMACSDFFVLASRFEGFPIVAIEALACGLPIISTPVSASNVYVHEGKNGYICDGTVDELANTMVKMSNLPHDEYLQFKKYSSALADEYSINLVVAKYESLFKDSLAKSR
jgi:glycosyltransferase involved in cell wall biosynthesis